jgi:cephalosporin hydroxylase
MGENIQFAEQVRKNIEGLGADQDIHNLSRIWLRDSLKHLYSYNFTWLSRPIIQYPQDMVAMQELIWRIKPDLIIETGIAHGGSLILSASMLALLNYCEAIESDASFNPMSSKRRVLGIDIDIRAHNRAAIEAHPLSSHITLIQGSSVAPEVVSAVHEIARNHKKILIFLDSNHTHEHVLAELEAYAPLVSEGSYCCVFDTVIEDLPADTYPDRPWGKGNNPKTSTREYLRRLKDEGRAATDGLPLNFEIDKSMENKLLITVAPEGYLRRVR